MLQTAVEETEQELIGQTGGAVNLLLILQCYRQNDNEDTEYRNSLFFQIRYYLGIQVRFYFTVSCYKISISWMIDVYYYHCLSK